MSNGDVHGGAVAGRASFPAFADLPSPRPAPVPASALDLMGELIGARLTVLSAPGWHGLPWEGAVVDETKNTFHVVPLSGGHERVLSKTALEGVLSWEGKAIRFKGDELRHRPEDRIKRLAPKGRSRRL